MSNMAKKIEEKSRKDSMSEYTSNKPIKKLDASILDRIEKKSNAGQIKLSLDKRRSTLKEIELQEYEKIEKLSTFNKVKKLQNLLKEMISLKKTFEINKNKIIDKINQNCFNYYKNKVNMKEIYDYCLSKNLQEHINYSLLKDPKNFLDEFLKDSYDDIHKFIFILRNNNKMMIKLIESCEQNDYEKLCDFMVNFFYEDTTNSSFIQEELMLIIYLIIEKNIISNKEEYSFNIFRKENNIVFHILKSLSRKADVRNFFCSILTDSINKLQGNRRYLSPNAVFYPDYYEEEEEDSYVLEKSEKNEEENDILKSYTMRNSVSFPIKKKDDKFIRLSTSINKYNIININKDYQNKINKKESAIHDNKNKKENKDKDKDKEILYLTENISEEELSKVKLDSFFDDKNLSLSYLEDKIKEYEHFSKNNSLNMAIKDYLNSLIKNINESKDEIYSNKTIVNFLKSIKIKMNEDNNEEKEKKEFNDIIEIIKKNYNEMVEIIDDIINKLKENITTVPVIIKCVSNIIEQLLNKKYIEKKQNKINNFQKYIFKSNVFIGNFLLSSLINPDYNGIFTSDIISKTTSENLKIIYDVLDKLLSGVLFTNNFETLFNKYIIETLPKIFDIIDKIEKNFKLPDVLQRLINTCTDINDEKRLNGFEYDYFFEKNEEIRYQSACFNFETLHLLIKLTEKNIDKIGNKEEKELFNKIFHYYNYFKELYECDLSEKKVLYLHLININFNAKLEKNINLMLRDNFEGKTPPQNEESISYFKKCLVEVLSYSNVINEESFRFFTDNIKQNIHDYNINNYLYKKQLKLLYNNIINGGVEEKKKETKIIEDEKLNFGVELFQKIMEYLKNELGKNIHDAKTQRIIFSTLFVQTHLNNIPKEYIENNYSKLFMELIKETYTILIFLKSNFLNHLYNKIKAGNKLNLIITSNYLQIKNLEKFKIIEYLYSKILLFHTFEIEKDNSGLITKITYIDEEKERIKKNKEKEKEKELLNDFVIINTELEEKEKEKAKPEPKKEPIKTLLKIIPDFRSFEGKHDNIVGLEEGCGVPAALKGYFKKLKNIVTKEAIVKRFNIKDIESIAIELENYILFKLYDRLYPTTETKEDIKFYKKCLRLNFIKPENIITDKNIYNEKLWQLSIDYLNEINSKFTPQDKIKTILKAFSILQNSISFCSGKKELGVDDTIKPLIYIFIKSKPKNIFTNYNFCQLFINDNLSKTQYGILLTQIFMIIKIIKDMKYNELIGVTEEQFGKEEEN